MCRQATRVSSFLLFHHNFVVHFFLGDAVRMRHFEVKCHYIIVEAGEGEGEGELRERFLY